MKSVDDAEEEAPERLEMTVTDVDHLIEFNPDTASVWIVDDDSKMQLYALEANNFIEIFTSFELCIPKLCC